MYSYVIRMSLGCEYVIRMSLLCTQMSSVCLSYVLVCHPYVIREWRACVVGVLAWVARLCGWRGGVLVCVAWGGGWRPNVGDMLLLLCCYWNTILKKKMMNAYFWNKKEKMFQIDLKSDLKEEPNLQSRCCFTLLEPVMPGSWIRLNPNVGKYVSICVTLWICLNMPETLRV